LRAAHFSVRKACFWRYGSRTYSSTREWSGALLAGFTANKIGRKRTIQLGSIIATVGQCGCPIERGILTAKLLKSRFTGCGIQTGSINVGMLIAGRFIAGVAIGVLSMIVPLYQVSRYSAA
jgi:MFS family permease